MYGSENMIQNGLRFNNLIFVFIFNIISKIRAIILAV